VSVAEPRMLKFQHCQKEETKQIWDQGKIKKQKKKNQTFFSFLSFFGFWKEIMGRRRP